MSYNNHEMKIMKNRRFKFMNLSSQRDIKDAIFINILKGFFHTNPEFHV